MLYYSDLSKNNTITIYGGEPSEKTSLGYDIAWYITTGIKWVVDLF